MRDFPTWFDTAIYAAPLDRAGRRAAGRRAAGQRETGGALAVPAGSAPPG
ncbi:hypothetical protein FAIPA1_210041 [Frankia sp. AiPs1]